MRMWGMERYRTMHRPAALGLHDRPRIPVDLMERSTRRALWMSSLGTTAWHHLDETSLSRDDLDPMPTLE